jgi:hypothetical protein
MVFILIPWLATTAGKSWTNNSIRLMMLSRPKKLMGGKARKLKASGKIGAISAARG